MTVERPKVQKSKSQEFGRSTFDDIVKSPPDAVSLERGVRARRLWYHDIELPSGLRTRFAEDYKLNPVLRGVDQGNEQLRARLADHIPPDLTGLTVLDLGCADGLFTFWAARHGAARVVGVERNRYNFERAAWLQRVLMLDNVELLCGAVERHCPAESFDVVFCVGLVYHLVDPLGVLHQIRTRCKKTLIFSSAVDLPDGNGEPMSRLDRYVTGKHGVWSFNVPMLRQLLMTAGFNVAHESVEGNGSGRRYLAIASPADYSDHHIFADTIDQEFPINLERRRKRVRAVWQELAENGEGPIALFGCGTHTPWLLDQVADIPGVDVTCVLDDRVPASGESAGLPVHRPTEIDPDSLFAVVLSSWHQTDALRNRAAVLFGDRVNIISLEA